jgi:very-short-patch-repair endonuclease
MRFGLARDATHRRVDPRVARANDAPMPRPGPNIHLGGGNAAQRGADWEIAALAGRQHGVVTVAQLLGLGVTRRMIETRLGAGRLHRIHRGVYAVGHSQLTLDGRWMAAVLACGEGAVLSHRSAAAVWGIRESAATRIDVSSPRRAGRSRSGIAVHRATTLKPADVTEVHSIPCTTVARTIVDLAAVVDRGALDYAIHRAESRRGLLDEGELARLLERLHGFPGTARISRLLGPPGQLSDDEAKSRLERAFLRLCRRAGLPEPRVNAWVVLPIAAGGLEVDFTWPDRRLAVETDSRRFHDTSRARRNDAQRDRALTLAGWRVARYGWWDVIEEPRKVAEEVRALLGA